MPTEEQKAFRRKMALEAVDSPMFGQSRALSEGEDAQLEILCLQAPVAVFRRLNWLLNDMGLMISIAKKTEVN